MFRSGEKVECTFGMEPFYETGSIGKVIGIHYDPNVDDYVQYLVQFEGLNHPWYANESSLRSLE